MALTLTQSKIRPLHGANVRSYTAGATVEVGRAVYIDSSDTVRHARANAAGTTRARGIVVAGEGTPAKTSYAAGEEVSVVIHGPVAGFTDMDNAEQVFVSSATAGVLTQTAPSGASTWVQSIGYPIRSDILMVQPQSTAPTANS